MEVVSFFIRALLLENLETISLLVSHKKKKRIFKRLPAKAVKICNQEVILISCPHFYCNRDKMLYMPLGLKQKNLIRKHLKRSVDFFSHVVEQTFSFKLE